MIRVLVVDDHPLIRRGLADLFAATDDIDLVAAACDGYEAVSRASDVAPDVVLMDLSMPGLEGVQATRQVLAASPSSAVVMLTSFTDEDGIRAAVDAGAVGYVLKDAEPNDLLNAVRAAARGESPFDARAATALLAPRPRPSPVEELTDRQRQVLVLVAEGLPNKAIARRLGISEKTVKTHLTSTFVAIGAADRTSAALWAQRRGLLP